MERPDKIRQQDYSIYKSNKALLLSEEVHLTMPQRSVKVLGYWRRVFRWECHWLLRLVF